MKQPVAKKYPIELKIHGDTRVDNYYWLNERENPEVIRYLEEENLYTSKRLEHTSEFQEDLFAEITGRIKQTDMSVPYRLNGYYYYTRYEEGKEYPLYCRKKGSLDADEEIMINGNEMAVGHAYFNINNLLVSPDNKLLAYSVDTVSRRIYTIHVKNLESGEIYQDRLEGSSGSMAWANNNTTLFYSTKDETLRPDKIWRHELGENQEDDALVFHEDDPTFLISVYNSKSKEYIMIGSFSTLTTEYRYLSADSPGGQFTVFQPRERELEYSVAHYKDKFYIRTNLDARNFRLMETPLGKTSKENWKEVIPHREEVLLDDFEVFDGFLALQERIDGLSQIRVINWQDDQDFYIEFPEQVFMSYFLQNPEFNTRFLRFGYSSLTTPNSVYDFNMVTRERELLKRQEVVGGYHPEEYFSERLWVIARDGKEVPVSLVYKKDLKEEGGNPLLLYGYGSYGASMDPYFSSQRLSLLDRGFIFAIAHIRGGEELGRTWYEQGKLLNKKNTFTDFIDCAVYLRDSGYVEPGKLFAMGGSAGGLLMGAVINMRPDLFDGVVAAVPFVDVVTTMLDESIPLTTGEYDEWGNPNDEEFYWYIKSYSPYDNVAEVDYPALLVTTGLHDSQVQYWEPAKWVAKMRDMRNGDNALLLWTNMDYGHGGASGRFARYKETAMEYAFLLDLAGIKE